MKQLLQNMRDGKAEVVEIPVPVVKPGFVLVRNQVSVVSAGTERMVVSFAEKNLLGKARSRPDLVKQVLEKSRREGVISTVKATFNRLDQPMALGYSSSGIVVEAGAGAESFVPGMRVACAGGGYATHSEFVLVPVNLLVPVADELSFEEAAFGTLGAISLQGFRLANPQIGDKVAIIGLGLLGLILGDIAQSAGCEVMGVDIDPQRIELAEKRGLFAVLRNNAENSGVTFTKNRGFDCVFICADSTSSDPVVLAGEMARDRGVVVSIGATGLEIPRKLYYEKEIQFLISRSYGPGRYDKEYEENGYDYPYGYVRWTEGRNLEAVIAMMQTGKLEVKSLITHRFTIEDGVQAYETITGKNSEHFLGAVLTYPPVEEKEKTTFSSKIKVNQTKNEKEAQLKLGVLGAGLYASAVFLPVVNKNQDTEKIAICSAKGLTARHAAKKFGYKYACTDENDVLKSDDINAVLIMTRHNDHPRQVIAALETHKHVYCEKPLAIDPESLSAIATAYSQANTKLMVGFNRRFSSLAMQMRQFFDHRSEPIHMHYRINAGYLPLTHWLHDPRVGGGRIIGESCHFIDFLVFLSDSKPISVISLGLPDLGKYQHDIVSMVFTFEDGSIGVIDYLANGDKNLPKEYLEAFCGGKVALLDDFRNLTMIEKGHTKKIKSRFIQDKGHQKSWNSFVECVRMDQESPIDFGSLWNVTQASFSAVESLKEKQIKPIRLWENFSN